MDKVLPASTTPETTPPSPPASKSVSKPGQALYDIAHLPEGIRLLVKEQFGQRVELYAPRENGGPYKGEIVNTPTHLLQEVGPRAIVIHDKAHVQLASKTLALRDQEHRLNNTDVQIHYAGKEGKAYPLDRQKDMLDRALGSLKKSASELGYNKDFMTQLDAAQNKTIERLKSLRQGHSAPKVTSPETADAQQPTRSR